MNWQAEAEKRRAELTGQLQRLIAIPSVLSEETSEQAPFGKEVRRALDWVLEEGERQGYRVKNVANMAGHLEIGEGKELFGILGHVDVVPAGSGWKHDPFGGAIEGNKLFGRGAIDDKGPTIAAWTALNMVKDSGLTFDKRVRLIIGTDEESGFRCVEKYFQEEEMPGAAFAPDADFPLINAEKGIAGLKFSVDEIGADDALVSFHSGERTNMVPDVATAVVDNSRDWQEAFAVFRDVQGLEGSIDVQDETATLVIRGKSAHAMEPDAGVNAGIHLATFLAQQLDGAGGAFSRFIADHFSGDSRGRALGLAYADEESGDTTLNLGIMRYVRGSHAYGEVSLRYSITYPFADKLEALKTAGITYEITSNSEPHYVDGDDPFVRTLQKAYEDNTGERAELLAIGGGTYARVLDKGVAFGMLFPGEPDVAHQADEFVDIDNLVKATAIYAQAISEWACKK